MYKNLLDELRKRMITVLQLSRKTGIGYNNLIAKIRGELEFTKNEMIKIIKVVKPDATDQEFEFLFNPIEIY